MELALATPERSALEMWQRRAHALVSDHFRRDDTWDAKPRLVVEVLRENRDQILAGHWDDELAERMVGALRAKSCRVRWQEGHSLKTLAAAIREWRRRMRTQIADINWKRAGA